MTALELIETTLLDMGVLAQNEHPSATEAQDARRRLNRLLESWSLSSLAVPSIQRLVFPTVAGQHTYTIGPGGQFDTVRPTSLVGTALLMEASPQTVAVIAADASANTITVAGNQTAIFPPGRTFNVVNATLDSHGVSINGVYTVRSATYTTVTVITPMEPVVIDATTGTIQVATATTPIELPRPVWTDDQYQSIQTKALPNAGAIWTGVYYSATAPLATLTLWPTPATATANVVLYVATPLVQFADLATAYDLPPGYFEALEWNLALRLIPSYAVANPNVVGMIREQAASTLATIKRSNTRMSDLMSDAWPLTCAPAYNIFTGTP